MMYKLHKWHQTKLGLLAFAFVELVLTYSFISLAIDRGNLWWYLLVLVFLVGTLQNIFKLIGKLFHGSHKTGKA